METDKHRDLSLVLNRRFCGREIVVLARLWTEISRAKRAKVQGARIPSDSEAKLVQGIQDYAETGGTVRSDGTRFFPAL